MIKPPPAAGLSAPFRQYRRPQYEKNLQGPGPPVSGESLLFPDFIAYCYDPDYQPHDSDPALLLELEDAVIVDWTDLAATAAEPVMFYKAAAEQVSQFTQRQQEQKPACVPKPLDLTKYGTRKLYIDTMLQDAGWTEGADWLNEYPVEGMPNASGTSAVS